MLFCHTHYQQFRIMKIVSSLKDTRNSSNNNIFAGSQKKWCFSRSENNRLTPAIWSGRTSTTRKFFWQGVSLVMVLNHRNNPLTISLTPEWCLYQRNVSKIIPVLFINYWFLRNKKLRNHGFAADSWRHALAHPSVPCRPGYPLVKSLGVVGIRQWKTEEYPFMLIPAFFQRWKSKDQDPYRKEEIKYGQYVLQHGFVIDTIKSLIKVWFLK